MKTSLDYRKDHLCVLSEREATHGPHTGQLREWYPVHKADRSEVRALLGVPVKQIDSGEGIYADEEGNVFRLAEGGGTEAIEVEQCAGKLAEATNTGGISLNGGLPSSKEAANRNHRRSSSGRHRGPSVQRKAQAARGKPGCSSSARGAGNELQEGEADPAETVTFSRLNLRQKLAVVRRRIAYVQKRGHNELLNYSYVTAADIAGAVGDILAELGVVVVPWLESITYEPARTGRMGTERGACVVMTYSFVDVDTGEEITVKVAGEGLDPGDKAPYKAMTGALKYALLQSFLLATGDDLEDERGDSRAAFGSEHPINAEQERQLQGLIEETGTDLQRVLAYYKISALSEMTEASYRRALDLLNRKLAKQSQGGGARAQN